MINFLTVTLRFPLALHYSHVVPVKHFHSHVSKFAENLPTENIGIHIVNTAQTFLNILLTSFANISCIISHKLVIHLDYLGLMKLF